MTTGACFCGRDSNATCQVCGKRVCGRHYHVCEKESTQYAWHENEMYMNEVLTRLRPLSFGESFDRDQASRLWSSQPGAVCLRCRESNVLNNAESSVILKGPSAITLRSVANLESAIAFVNFVEADPTAQYSYCEGDKNELGAPETGGTELLQSTAR